MKGCVLCDFKMYYELSMKVRIPNPDVTCMHSTTQTQVNILNARMADIAVHTLNFIQWNDYHNLQARDDYYYSHRPHRSTYNAWSTINYIENKAQNIPFVFRCMITCSASKMLKLYSPPLSRALLISTPILNSYLNILFCFFFKRSLEAIASNA